MSAASGSICVTGIGMVSSLGFDAATACAAARAGLVRSRELDDFPVRSPDGEVQGVVGHAVPGIADGFEGEARLLRIAGAALSDLRRQAPGAFWKSAQPEFFLSFPDPGRIYTGLDLIADDGDRAAWASEAKEKRKEPTPDSARRVLTAAAKMARWPETPNVAFVAFSETAGVAEALIQAMRRLRSGAAKAVVVGGVDSLLEVDVLNWLERTERLKTPDRATGLQPGEAGAFLLLEDATSATARGATILGCVRDAKMAEGQNTLLGRANPTGASLAELVGRLFENESSKAGPSWFITDHNGEAYRGLEWGNALVRLRRSFSEVARSAVWHPAASFGHTGAAAGALSIAVALRSFARGCAPDSRAVVTATADGTKRAAMVIEAVGA